MRICHLASSFLPAIGGMEIAVHNIATSLVNLGHEAWVLTSKSEDNTRLDTNYNIKRYSIPEGRIKAKAYLLCSIFRLIEEKIKAKFDVLHAHCTYPPGYCGAVLKNIINIPLIITPQGKDIQRIPEINYGIRLNPKFDRRVRYALYKADAITSISSSIREDIIDAGGKENKIYNIPNGVNLERFAKPQSNIRELFNLPSDSKIILAVGRNHPKKGYQTLIEAMGLIQKKSPNAKCVIIGRDTDTLLPLIDSLNIRQHVVLAGQIPKRSPDNTKIDLSQLPHKDLVSCYMTSDIFVSPSIIEGFSLVVVEAMAAGLPVVATDVPGNKDAIRDGVNGFLVPPRDPVALAERIKHLLDNESLRKKMSKKSFEFSMYHDWKIITKKYLEVYERISNRHA